MIPDIPQTEDLTIDSIRNILVRLTDHARRHQVSTESQLSVRPTFQEITSSFASLSQPGQSLYVDLYAIDGIFRQLTTNVLQKLDEVTERNQLLENEVDRLFRKIHQAVKHTNDKSSQATKFCEKALNCTREIKLDLYRKNQLRRILKSWKTLTQNKKDFKKIIRKRVKNSNSLDTKHCLGTWSKSIENDKTQNTITKQHELLHITALHSDSIESLEKS